MEDLHLHITPGLELISAASAHAEALLAMLQRNRSHIGRYLPKVTELDSIGKVQAHLTLCIEQWQARALFEFHVFHQGELCGILRLNHFAWEDRQASLAYLLDEAHTGRGILTQAARAVLAFGFHTLDLNRVELRCVTTNRASQRVAERLGFTREGELRETEWLEGAPVNDYVYGLLRREFERGQVLALDGPGSMG